MSTNDRTPRAGTNPEQRYRLWPRQCSGRRIGAVHLEAQAVILLILIAAIACLPSRSMPIDAVEPPPVTLTPMAWLPLVMQSITPAPSRVRFAVIGDYGLAGQNEERVANLVESWNPDFIITTGDNNYPNGESSTIDRNIGQYYHNFIFPYTGRYGAGATSNRFYPSLGNHDWNTAGAAPYRTYFTLPGNERYYDLAQGPVHLFAIDSDSHEPDGATLSSNQAVWLHDKLAASTSCWNLVYFHHAPYSSGLHGSSTQMQWPFQAWGADAVLAGHDHTYERIVINGFPYFVNGLGGSSRYAFGTPVTGSEFRYNASFGAMRVTATQATILYEFIAADGTIIDAWSQNGRCAAQRTGIGP